MNFSESSPSSAKKEEKIIPLHTTLNKTCKEVLSIPTANDIIIMMILPNNKLAVGTIVGTIEIYNLITKQEETTIQASDDDITWLTLSQNKLISLSADGKVSIFKIEGNDYKFLHSFIPFEHFFLMN